jgi:hypothetical protein
VHDFLIAELGRAASYRVYDLAANTGWANVGIDNDTGRHSPCRLYAVGGRTSAAFVILWQGACLLPQMAAAAMVRACVCSEAEMASINIKRADFHGEWNYTIAPTDQLCEALVS